MIERRDGALALHGFRPIRLCVPEVAGRSVPLRKSSPVAGDVLRTLSRDALEAEIVRNVAQAASGTSEVTGNLAGVARASEDTGAAASQVLASASALSRQSEHLSAEVKRFLATIRAA